MPTYRLPTGKLLRVVRPETYRQVVDLLAEPREHVSYREIARVCKVGGSTIKAIQRAEAESIQASKARLLRSSLRIAQAAADRVEDTISEAGCSQAAIVYGISTEKSMLLMGEPTHHVAVSLNPVDIYAELRQIQ